MSLAILGALVFGISGISTIANATEILPEEYKEDKAICYAAAETEGIESPVEKLYKLQDLSGNVFYVQVGEESGFMVYDSKIHSFIEKSANLKSPYNFKLEKDYYYFGPMNYYERIEDEFFSLTDNQKVGLNYAYSMQEIFDQQLKIFRDAQSVEAYNTYYDAEVCRVSLASVTVGNRKYVNNYQYIRDAVHPSNYDNSCGYIAASIILQYWDKTMHKGTVRSQFYDNNDNLNDTLIYSPNTNLKDKLIQLSGGTPESWGQPVRDALIAYCDEYGIGASSSYYIGKFGLDSELAAGRPAIIFGALPKVQAGSGLGNHAVVAYGIQNEWWGGYYIVNYGYNSNYAEVSLGFSFVGSVCFFQLSNDYEKAYSIPKNCYDFPDEYCANPIDKTIYSGGLTFNTTRLRTGYIHSEYVTLSPRKAGYGTAYIEYKFTNPVRKIEVDLSYWSNDERYYVNNNPEARIEYQRLCETTWLESLDLLAANLSTDRNNQKTYTIEFSGGTRLFRLYTHFDTMTGFTDRNKGRISIGDMVVYTYW